MNNILQGIGLGEVIRRRRTVKPDRMNGRVIPDNVIPELLEAADWAPTHAHTEPWRFIVFDNSMVKVFAKRHADLYRLHTSEGAFTQQKYDNLVKLGDNVSHIIVAWMKRIANHKIPEIEELAATSAAIQNLLLTATSLGIASFWSTGGLTHNPVFKKEFDIGDEDSILGIIYLGYSDEPQKHGNRLIPLTEKVEWRKQ